MGSIQNDLGSSVPPGNDVLGEGSGALFVATSKTEVADLEVAVLVKEKVAGLEITMDNVGRVDVETSSEQLVHEVLAVVVCQILTRVNHTVHVRLHQVGDDVNIFVARGSRGLLHVHEADDVLMVEEL